MPPAFHPPRAGSCGLTSYGLEGLSCPLPPASQETAENPRGFSPRTYLGPERSEQMSGGIWAFLSHAQVFPGGPYVCSACMPFCVRCMHAQREILEKQDISRLGSVKSGPQAPREMQLPDLSPLEKKQTPKIRPVSFPAPPAQAGIRRALGGRRCGRRPGFPWLPPACAELPTRHLAACSPSAAAPAKLPAPPPGHPPKNRKGKEVISIVSSARKKLPPVRGRRDS